MSYRAVKEFIDSYAKPFDKDKRSRYIARKRLRDRGERTTRELVNEEIKVVLEEWQQKAKIGEEIHNRIQEREMKKIPLSIKEEYIPGDTQLNDIEVNKLEIGKTYFEKRILSNLYNLSGRADKVYIDNKGYIHIEEYKTWETININYTAIADNGFIIKDYFLHPLGDYLDSNFSKACLQASIYMYLLWNTNKRLKPGSIKILHIKIDEDGNITDEKQYEVAYRIDEVKKLLTHDKYVTK